MERKPTTDSFAIARALLETEGYRVSEAENGVLALEALDAAGEFSLVILDLDMPVLDGEAVLSRIRGSVATAALPVVVLTGSSDQDLEAELIDQGADDYIRKPIDPPRFLARVRAALRRARG